MIIRAYGVAGHGKSEVDGVGAVVKVAVRNAVGNALDCKVFLDVQLKSNVIRYQTDLFDVEELTASREKLKYTKFSTVHGSSKFMVMLVSPGQERFLAGPRICLCDNCSSGKFADCDAGLFKEYQLSSNILNQIQLRNADKVPGVDIAALQIQEACVVVVRCEDANFPYYLIKVLKRHPAQERSASDDFGHEVPAGFPYIEGHYLERKTEVRGETRYTVSKKPVFFYTDSVLYPCVVFTENKNEIRINDSELVMINDFITSG